jgi:hypothetical protein
MPALSDRVRETSTTTGTGTFSLAGAVTGFVSFSSAFGNGVSVYYVAALGAEWEIGIGTTGAGTLSRDTVIASSAGGTTKVTFSAGAKDVFCSIPAVGLVTTDDVATTNTANKVVKRDGSGNFAAGTITANLTGNVSGSSGSTTGNAATATALQTARNINGVSFNGTADITVAAAAGTLTGNTLASGVTASSLTSVGTLTSLTVSGNLTVDTNTLAVVASTNRVGILNASPGSTLHIGSTVASGGLADSFFNVNFTAASNTLVGVQDAVVQGYIQSAGTIPEMRIASYTAHPVAILTTNAAHTRFATAGHVLLVGTQPRIGINQASPAHSIHIGTASQPVAVTSQVALCESTSAITLTDGTRHMYIAVSSTLGAYFGTLTNHPFDIYSNNNLRWQVAAAGHLLAGVDNTYDIGASGATRPRDLYLARNMVGAGWVRAGAASAGAASTTTFGSTTSTTVGATGAASALPANPLGYLVAHVGTTEVRIPYYNA